MKIFPVVCLFALAFSVSAQQPLNQPNAALEPIAFTSVDLIGEGTRSFFVFGVNGFHYIIRADGHAESDDGKPKSRNFELRVGRNGHLVRVYSAEYDGDLLLIYEASDKQYGWGYVMRMDQKTLKPKWVKPVSSFNIGPGLMEGDCAYFGAADLLTKLDLRTGNYVWQQQKFREQYVLSSDGFRLPAVNGERLLFIEDAENGKSIEVSKTTGKILGVRN
jgi:hypothetical protein